MNPIKITDWKPTSKGKFDYTLEFVKWINSINSGFQNKTVYDKFEMYKLQAEQWNEEEYNEIWSETQKIKYINRERQKASINSLYSCNKYLWLKDSVSFEGRMKFKAWEAQEIIFFLMDCGYNLLIGKTRQIGATSAIGGAGTFKASFMLNYFLKFVTLSESDKLKEIFDDKFKYAYENLPEHIKPTAGNYSDGMVKFFTSEKKGERIATGGKILISLPRIDAITGGSPSLVLIDEAGQLKNFSAILREGRPALFYINPVTGELEMKHHVISWGTVGNMEEAGKIFEEEWHQTKEKWEKRNYKYGIIPLFFNAYARPGITREFLEREKSIAYNKLREEERINAIAHYHQTYPITEEDMFVRNARYIMPLTVINAHIERINYENKPVKFGYLEPVYDVNVPYFNDKYLTHKVINAVFRQTTDYEDPRTTTIVFSEPDMNWKYRFYKGTDPVNAESGHSKLASAVWDAELNTIAAITNLRGYGADFSDKIDDSGLSAIKQSFRESYLLNIYYGLIPELIEGNQGAMYIDLLDNRGMMKYIVGNGLLPRHLQTTTERRLGIYNNSSNSKGIMDEFIELLDLHAGNIYIRQFFNQLKTFSEKQLKSGKIRYQAEDLSRDFDDMIFAVAYSYICRKCFLRHTPYKINDETKKQKTKIKMTYDANYNLRRSLVTPEGKIIKYY